MRRKKKLPEATPDKAQAEPYDLVTFETGKDGALNVTQYDNAQEKIFGSKSPAVNEGLFLQCFVGLNEIERSDGGEDRRSFMPAIVREIAPADGIERLLAVQMATTHVAVIRQGKRMAHAEQLPQFEAHERAFNKLARTFATQVQTLKKYRSKGEQVVRIERVTVEEGGQAAIGLVQTGGRATDER